MRPLQSGPHHAQIAAADDDAERRRRFSRGVAAAPHAARGNDLYETPVVAVRALLAAEPLDAIIWEPACGPGAIVRVLRAAGHTVVATDLVDYGCSDAHAGVDFLRERSALAGAGMIVTNPPFRLAAQFVRKGLELVPRVVMLLPLTFLEGKGRSDIIDGGHLARVHVFSARLPMMHRHGWTGRRATNTRAYGWFVWDRDYDGRPVVHRITAEADRRGQA